jgi:hypothetical protein
MTKGEATEQPPEDQALSGRRRLMEQLTAEIDQLKRVIEGSKHGGRQRIFYDFERPVYSMHREVKHISMPERARPERTLSEVERVGVVMDYMAEIRTLPLVDVLRQSRKLVFSNEWEVAYREREHAKIYSKIERLRKRSRLVKDPRKRSVFTEAEVEYHRKRIAGEHLDKTRRVAMVMEELEGFLAARVVYDSVDEFLVSKRLQTRAVLPVRAVPPTSMLYDIELNPSGDIEFDPLQWLPLMSDAHRAVSSTDVETSHLVVPHTGRGDPARIFPPRSWETKKAPRSVQSRMELLQSFEQFLHYFSKCLSSQSKRSVFQISYPLSGIHATSHHIFKKVQGEYLKCRSAKDVIAYKYRNVAVESASSKPSTVLLRKHLGPFDDEDSLYEPVSSQGAELDLSLVLSPDGGEGKEEQSSIEKTNLETSFDRFLNERTRRSMQHGMAETGPHNPKFTDFIKTAHPSEMAWSGEVGNQKLISEFYRSFSNRTGPVPKPLPETKEESKPGTKP